MPFCSINSLQQRNVHCILRKKKMLHVLKCHQCFTQWYTCNQIFNQQQMWLQKKTFFLGLWFISWFPAVIQITIFHQKWRILTLHVVCTVWDIMSLQCICMRSSIHVGEKKNKHISRFTALFFPRDLHTQSPVWFSSVCVCVPGGLYSWKCQLLLLTICYAWRLFQINRKMWYC